MEQHSSDGAGLQPAKSEAKRVLLVGWDAADWKVIHPLMDAGKMPHLQRLVENGASGQISTLHPPLSPMLWTSIATGKRPFKHGIHGFAEPTPDGRGVQPVTNLSRKSKALWNILNQNHLRSAVIGWWPSHPAEPIDGVMVSDHYHRANRPLEQGWPLLPDAVHPRELAATLAALRMHPDLLTPPMVEPFIPLAKDIDQENDKRLAMFLRTLAECVSIHSAAVWLLDHPLDNRPWDFFAVYYDSIDHFCHGFMKYHPPRQSWIGERDFELYRNVVSMAYQLHDGMLGTLLEKAGQDTTVIVMSDHGFHPDHLRPASIPDIPAGPAVEHRDFGILASGGPAVKKGEPLHGASVLDIAPTILTLYGLPVGEDMDGKVLSQAFVNAPKVASIPSWEEVPGADGRHPPHTRLDPVAAHEALEQMIALGYIERLDEDREAAVEKTIRELRYNLGEAYQDGGRHIEAHRIFTELCAVDPDEQRFAVRLFVSCQALGMRQEMRRIADDLDGRRRVLFEEAKTRLEALRGDEHLNDGERRELARWRNLARYQPAVADYLKAQVLTAEGRYADALAALERVTGGHLVRSTGGHLVRPTGGHLVRSTGGHLVRSTEGHLVRPTEGRLERPTEGRLARPTEGQRVRPTEGRLARPTEGQRVRPAEGHLVRPTEGQRVQPADGHLAQPGLFLQTADLYLRLRRWGEARQIYETVLAIDPDSADAHLGMSRVALRRRKFSVAAHSALDALQRVYHDPSAHFLLGLALSGMKEYERAAEAFRAAISFNPNFPEAHLRLASVLEKHLGDPESARAHRRLARRMKSPHGDGSALQSTRNSQAFSPAGLRCAGEFLKSAKGAGRTPKPAQGTDRAALRFARVPRKRKGRPQAGPGTHRAALRFARVPWKRRCAGRARLRGSRGRCFHSTRHIVGGPDGRGDAAARGIPHRCHWLAALGYFHAHADAGRGWHGRPLGRTPRGRRR